MEIAMHKRSRLHRMQGRWRCVWLTELSKAKPTRERPCAALPSLAARRQSPKLSP